MYGIWERCSDGIHGNGAWLALAWWAGAAFHRSRRRSAGRRGPMHAAAAPSYDIAVFRRFAGNFWHVAMQAAAEYGYRVVAPQ
jgi:hypothetical protein